MRNTYHNHGLTPSDLLLCFYQGINTDSQGRVNKAAGGSKWDLSPTVLEEKIENLVRASSKVMEYFERWCATTNFAAI